MSMDRKTRVAQALRDALSEMIAREVKDPRVARAGVVSVTHVDLNADLSVATVYVSIVPVAAARAGRASAASGGLDDEAAAQRALEGLRSSSGFLRGPLGRRLRLVRPPELRFLRDNGTSFGMELSRIVRDDEARARAAGRGGAGDAAGAGEGVGERAVDAPARQAADASGVDDPVDPDVAS